MKCIIAPCVSWIGLARTTITPPAPAARSGHRCEPVAIADAPPAAAKTPNTVGSAHIIHILLTIAQVPTGAVVPGVASKVRTASRSTIGCAAPSSIVIPVAPVVLEHACPASSPTSLAPTIEVRAIVSTASVVAHAIPVATVHHSLKALGVPFQPVRTRRLCIAHATATAMWSHVANDHAAAHAVVPRTLAAHTMTHAACHANSHAASSDVTSHSVAHMASQAVAHAAADATFELREKSCIARRHHGRAIASEGMLTRR